MGGGVIKWIIANPWIVAGIAATLIIAGLYLRQSGYASCTSDRDAQDTAQVLQQSLAINHAQDFQAQIQAALHASHNTVTQTIGASHDASIPPAVISGTVGMLYDMQANPVTK